MEPRNNLKDRQDAGQRAYDRMLTLLLGYTPCAKLTVEDVQFIARFAQTVAFDAATDVSA